MSTTLPPEEVKVPQAEKVIYTAKAHTTCGRDGGASRSSDGQRRYHAV